MECPHLSTAAKVSEPVGARSLKKSRISKDPSKYGETSDKRIKQVPGLVCQVKGTYIQSVISFSQYKILLQASLFHFLQHFWLYIMVPAVTFSSLPFLI